MADTAGSIDDRVKGTGIAVCSRQNPDDGPGIYHRNGACIYRRQCPHQVPDKRIVLEGIDYPACRLFHPDYKVKKF